MDESAYHELNEVEKLLGRLAPRPARLDRDELMFRAGQAAVARTAPPGWLWPATTAAMLLIAAALGWLLMEERRTADRLERLLAANENSASALPIPIADAAPVAAAGQDMAILVASPLDRQAYWELRVRMLDSGAESIPISLKQRSPSPHPTYRELLDSWLGPRQPSARASGWRDLQEFIY